MLLQYWYACNLLVKYSSKKLEQVGKTHFKMYKGIFDTRLRVIGILVGLSIGWGCILKRV